MNVSVKVKAGVRKESVKELSPGRFEISVREKAERNQANARVMAIIAARFKVDPKRVRIMKGHRSPSKVFEILPPSRR